MSESPDLVIRGGTVADGRGGDLFEADVAIRDGRISEVGKISGKGRDEIDARGKLVAPGFVDIHTHYDGQVTWSQDMTPSSQNGVTTAVMGNCGVGFAPCRPDDHLRLIELMEGVEDIPEPVLSAGIPWSWESFPDYMEWLAARGASRLCDGRARRAPRSLHAGGQRGDGKTCARGGALRRTRLLDLAHPQPPHLDRRLHADAEGRRGRTDRNRRGHAWRRPQRAAIRARSLDAARRPSNDAAGRRKDPVPDLILDHPERPRTGALAPDARRDQRRGREGALDHRADRRPPGRAHARARIVAQSVPDPSELQGDRASAAQGAADAPASTRGARRDPE